MFRGVVLSKGPVREGPAFEETPEGPAFRETPEGPVLWETPEGPAVSCGEGGGVGGGVGVSVLFLCSAQGPVFLLRWRVSAPFVVVW